MTESELRLTSTHSERSWACASGDAASRISNPHTSLPFSSSSAALDWSATSPLLQIFHLCGKMDKEMSSTHVALKSQSRIFPITLGCLWIFPRKKKSYCIPDCWLVITPVVSLGMCGVRKGLANRTQGRPKQESLAETFSACLSASDFRLE